MIKEFFDTIKKQFPGAINIFVEPKGDSKLGPANSNIFKLIIEYEDGSSEINFYTNNFQQVIY